MAYFEKEGFQIYYEAYPGLVDQDTVLIHGNLACHLWWHPTRDLLQKQRSKIQRNGKLILVDWRGCGGSKGLTSKEEINFDVFAEDVLDLAISLNLRDINVVGHSTGGLIAMLAILKSPSLFKSLVLLDSIGPYGIELQIPEEQVLQHFQMISEDKEICDQVIGATIEGVDFQSPLFQAIARATFEVDKAIWLGVPETLIRKINIADRMKDLQLPTLVLHGEKDLVLPLDGSRRLHDMIEGSQFKSLPNQGHSFNVEAPEKFLNELQTFWSEL